MEIKEISTNVLYGRRVTKVDKKSGYTVHWMMDSYEYGRLESVDAHPGDMQPGNRLVGLF